MSSSTSSFRREIPVWLAVALVFVAMEAAFRLIGARVSDNLARVEQIPQQARTLAAATARPRVLMLGNSLTIKGIDDARFRQETSAALDRDLAYERIALYGADTTEWYWIVDQQFASTSHMPDVIVVNIDDDFAKDIPTTRSRRLALYFPVFSRPFVPAVDIPTFESRAEFVLAKFSQAYSRAKNLGVVALGKLTPHGEAGSEWVRVRLGNRVRKGAADIESPPPSYERLRRLAELARRHDARMVCVFMPHREPYEITGELRRTLADAGATLVDLRDPGGVAPLHFDDDRHLTPTEGASRFTPAYARRLAEEFSAWTSSRSGNSDGTD